MSRDKGGKVDQASGLRTIVKSNTLSRQDARGKLDIVLAAAGLPT